MIRVLLADDHNLVREGLRALLEKASDIQVVGEAENGQQAVELAAALSPDVLVMDISMPRLNGAEATLHVRSRRPAPEVVILSMYSDEMLVRQALRNGARGYLLKRSVAEELLLAVRSAVRGETYLSPGIAAPLVEEYVRETGLSPVERLSTREREVLQLIAEGLSNARIAATLHITLKTVEKHRANVMAALGVRDLPGLIRTAIRYRLISMED